MGMCSPGDARCYAWPPLAVEDLRSQPISFTLTQML